MFNFSSGEIIIVVLLAVIFCKPEDLSKIAKQFNQLKQWLDNTYKEIMSQINNSSETIELDNNREEFEYSESERDKINFYITEILKLGGKVEADYDLSSLRSKYLELLEENFSKSHHTDQNGSNKTG